MLNRKTVMPGQRQASKRQVSAVPIIVSALLLGAGLSGLSSGMELTEQYAVTDNHPLRVALTAASLSAALGDYDYANVTPESARVRDQALSNYLRGSGLQRLWQDKTGGVLSEVWYSPETDLTVIAVHDALASGKVNLNLYTMPGRIAHKNMLML